MTTAQLCFEVPTGSGVIQVKNLAWSGAKVKRTFGKNREGRKCGRVNYFSEKRRLLAVNQIRENDVENSPALLLPVLPFLSFCTVR